MTVPFWSPHLGRLIHGLDEAVQTPDCQQLCENVKATLSDVLPAYDDLLHPSLLRPVPSGYARRLLHLDPAGRYSVIVMSWDQGQGTPLHDHGGLWCVECVYTGKIRVTCYELAEGQDRDRLRFVEEDVITSSVGDAGALIPPFDYHIIDNPFDEPATTVHVYGGEMTWGNTFTPVGDGCYRRDRRKLAYTPLAAV